MAAAANDPLNWMKTQLHIDDDYDFELTVDTERRVGKRLAKVADDILTPLLHALDPDFSCFVHPWEFMDNGDVYRDGYVAIYHPQLIDLDAKAVVATIKEAFSRADQHDRIALDKLEADGPTWLGEIQSAGLND